MKDKLTKQEIEIAKFIVSGFSDIGISRILFISVNTIKTHKYHIYKKLGIEKNKNYNQRVLLVHNFMKGKEK